tara:strand:- start:461 stop:1090 length:630 start_codon:yes stop_codon:yes gene_type:complete
MLQNKYSFNQSSAELEIAGLPDYSKNDNKENISIISNWKLSIINQPDIEGSVDHLKSVIKAFYKCAALALLNQEEKIESDLIDLNLDNDGNYNILLKSTKTNIKPLNLKIGFAEFSDIINCFDQLKNSSRIDIDFKDLMPVLKKSNTFKFNKESIFIKIFPPLLAFFSISFFALLSVYFYENKDNGNNKLSLLNRNFISNNSYIVIKIK